MKTLEQRTRKQRRRFVLYPFFPFYLCEKPRWRDALSCHQFPLNVSERVFLFFFLLLVWFKLLSTPGSRWWRRAGRPQGALLGGTNYTAKCAGRYQAEQLKPPRIVLFPKSPIWDSSDGTEGLRHLPLGFRHTGFWRELFGINHCWLAQTPP